MVNHLIDEVIRNILWEIAYSNYDNKRISKFFSYSPITHLSQENLNQYEKQQPLSTNQNILYPKEEYKILKKISINSSSDESSSLKNKSNSLNIKKKKSNFRKSSSTSNVFKKENSFTNLFQ